VLNVVKNPDALRDIEEIFVYIGADNVDAALRFKEAAERAVQFLARHPYAGRSRHFSARALRGLRSWGIHGFETYVIFYFIRQNSVEIFRVMHGARDLERRLGE
jgi:toxin ParE1/3/4